MEIEFASRSGTLDALIASGRTTDFWYAWCDAVEEGYVKARGLDAEEAKKLKVEVKSCLKMSFTALHISYIFHYKNFVNL